MKSTVLTNIYNEEYLLPFWLEHHKTMFDHGIIIDYRSTDRSVEICKEICPTWEVRTSQNAHFGAIEIDAEFMEIEKTLDGIKMILNTTEFLYTDKPIAESFDENTPASFGISAYGAYSATDATPINMQELEQSVLMENVMFRNEWDRGHRQIHTFPTGNYGLGRHSTDNPWIETNSMAILWLGFYPWNQRLIDRKMQIRTNIPQSDRDKGYSYHHFYDLPTLQEIRNYWCVNGGPIHVVCSNLQRMIQGQIYIDNVKESGLGLRPEGSSGDSIEITM